MGARVCAAKFLIPALFLLGLGASAAASPPIQVVAATNPIVTENALPGTGAWLITNNARDGGQIKGYASATSVLQGQPLTLYVSVNPAQTYAIDFYRIGWYGGVGGRLVAHVDQPLSPTQPSCGPSDPTTGLFACNWQPSYTLTVPSSWTSGVYVALMTNAAGYQNYVIFVVRDGRPASFLYQAAFTTYEAYNNYPNDNLTGKSLYDFNSYGANTVAGSPRAVKVSFDRPYTDMGTGQFFWFEVYFVHWLERNGYDVTYSTDVDTHANGAELKNHKALLSVAHDEYWSMPMFTAVAAARDAGVNLGFFTANAAFWQIRFESSASGAANRVVVCYKSPGLDPVQDSTTTVNFRSAPVNMPEQTLEGVQFTSSIAFANAVPYVVANSSHWVYAGTGFKDGDSVPGIVGYEMDRLFSTFPPPTTTNQTLLSRSPFTNDTGQADYANSSIYQAPSGAWVFAAGTIEWSWGLDNSLGHNAADARIQQTTANILNAFLNGAPVAQTLKVTAPVSATAGQAFTTTVAAVNAQGNPATAYTGTVHFTSSDPAAVLPPDYVFTSGDAGTHQFQLTLKTAGTQTITATDTVTPSITGSQTVTVGPAAAATLTLSGLAGAIAGTAQTATVTARDVYGNLATGYLETVAFTSSDSQASLPANYSFVAADGGVHSFPGGVTLRTPGTQWVSVTDTANAALTSQQTVTIAPSATAASLSVSGLTNAAAGVSQTVTVTARDASGNVVTGYTGTITFSSTDSQASLPANYTFLAADNGVHNFPGGVILRTAGTQIVAATDTGNAGITGSQSVTVSPGPLASLALTPSSSSITAGGSQGYTAAGSDQYGNSLGDLTASTTFTIAPNGSCTGAICTAIVAGSHAVTGSNTGITGTASLTVGPGPLNQLTISPSSATLTAGGSQGYTAAGSDQYGNSLGDLTASTTFTIAPNGSCTSATCTATVAGAHTVTGTNAGKTATASLTITPGPLNRLTLAPSSATITAGGSQGYTATGFDLYGNSLGDLTAGTTFTIAPNGSCSGSSCTATAAGAHTVTGTNAGKTATASLNVVAAAASQLTLTAPSTATANHAFNITVTLRDQYGNVATGYRGTVHFTTSDLLAQTLGDMPSDYTFTAADAGAHTFTAALATVGNQTITTTDTANGSLTDTKTVAVSLL
jgi:N,N-dimethylformamidase beta subunit-like protein